MQFKENEVEEVKSMQPTTKDSVTLYETVLTKICFVTKFGTETDKIVVLL